MNDQILLLVIGAIIGLISAISVEMIRHYLDKNRGKLEQERVANDLREQKLRDFFEAKNQKGITSLAWIKLVRTQSLPLYYQIDDVTKPVLPKSKFSFWLWPIKEKSKVTIFDNDVNTTINKFMLGKTQVIGRQKDCEIHLSDVSASRLHAMIRYEEGEYVVYDLGSTLGTFVNDDKVSDDGIYLVSGDRIIIGKSVFIFQGPRLKSNNKKRTQHLVEKQITNDEQENDSISTLDTQEIKKCEIHGSYSYELRSCPICDSERK